MMFLVVCLARIKHMRFGKVKANHRFWSGIYLFHEATLCAIICFYLLLKRSTG